MADTPFLDLLRSTQKHISQNYPQLLTPSQYGQLRPYILHYLQSQNLTESSSDELVEEIYSEMVESSILTPWLERNDVEEININSWDDVAVTFTSGQVEKVRHFYSPQHAADVVKRLLSKSDMSIDAAIPQAEGYLPGNKRITVLLPPILPDGIGVSASIRLLHPARITETEVVHGETATQEMIDFQNMCLRYNVPVLIGGETMSGKTSTLNALLQSLPNEKRLFSIESGSREFDLVKRDNTGQVTNNIVSTLTRPSEVPNQNISQEDLVVKALRFNPDLIVIGEMRDVEAYAAVEASLTGHCVASTTHAYASSSAHLRLALLCQKRFPMEFRLSMMQVAQAFPIVVYQHKMEDYSRKVLDISECIVDDAGNRTYRCLYRYVVVANSTNAEGKPVVQGYFEKVNNISDNLQQRLRNGGAPASLINHFLAPEQELPRKEVSR